MSSPTTVISSSVKLDVPPTISPLDSCKYRALTLPNDLSVLLVSDNLSEHAAASMDVAVGSYSDPPEIPGLAHFLEHMLFMGTEKYPDEGSYSKFISLHGGSPNACTGPEHTNFHFDIVATSPSPGSERLPNFYEALDRFAQFFIAPAFTHSSTDREVNAVHSEYKFKLQSDCLRIAFVGKANANPAHPYSAFTIGSRETLSEIPLKKDIDVRAALLDFHAKHYSANIMKLVVVAPYSLDVLQEWVVELFSEVQNREVDKPWRAYENIPVLLPHQYPCRYFVKTIADIRSLEMDWMIPPALNDYQSKSGALLCCLLEDEGEGSILSILKSRGWGEQLGSDIYGRRSYAELYVAITLTSNGFSHIDDVIAVVYDYIRLLRKTGLPEWLFKQEALILERQFRFRDRPYARCYAEFLAKTLHYKPSEDCVSASYLAKEYCPEKFMQILDKLTPVNGNVFVAAQSVADDSDLKEKWFEAQYRVDALGEDDFKSWETKSSSTAMKLPKQNPYIPTDFNVLGEPLMPGEDDGEGPCRILHTEHMELYHKIDRTFNRPTIVLNLRMATPMVYASPWHSVMATLYINLLDDALTEHAWATGKAGYVYDVDTNPRGVDLYMSGYSDGFGEVLVELLEKLKGLEINLDRYEVLKEDCIRQFENAEETASPTDQINSRLHSLLYECKWERKDRLECLRDGSITFEMMKEYSKKVVERSFVTGLVYGSVDQECATGFMNSVQDILKFEVLPYDQRPRLRVVQVPLGGNVFWRQKNTNVKDDNSCIEVYYQAEALGNFKEDVKLELIGTVLEDTFFHELRTVQQMGYFVDEGDTYDNCVGGIYFTVQSAVASPDELLRRIEKFLVDVRAGFLCEMSDEKFGTIVKSMIRSKREGSRGMDELTSRYWAGLCSVPFLFDRDEREAEALESVTKEDMLEFFDEYIAECGAKRRRVVVQVYGKLHSFEERESLTGDGYEICNAARFRRGHGLHAVDFGSRPGCS